MEGHVPLAIRTVLQALVSWISSIKSTWKMLEFVQCNNCSAAASLSSQMLLAE